MKNLLTAVLAALSVLVAPPALAQRLLAPYEIEQLIAPIAHYPDAAIQDSIAAHPDLAFTYAHQPSEVWRVVLELRQRISPPSQAIIIHQVPRHVVVRKPQHHHHLAPPSPNGPPSPAVQMQQGHKPSPAVQMQQRIPESQRQPIVQQRFPSWDANANQPHRPWRGAP